MPKPKKPAKKAGKAEPAPAEGGDDAAASAWTCPSCEYEHEGEDAASAECIACGEPRPAADEADDAEDDRYKGIVAGLVTSIEELSNQLKACTVDVGAGTSVSVVTNATNVAEGARVCVAKVGARLPAAGDGEVVVAKRSVGGRTSDGMLCDAPALGWSGGGAGAAALLPPSFAPGDRPPDRRPRMDGK